MASLLRSNGNQGKPRVFQGGSAPAGAGSGMWDDVPGNWDDISGQFDDVAGTGGQLWDALPGNWDEIGGQFDQGAGAGVRLTRPAARLLRKRQ